ncbi:MAG: tetratricopeptide repeat protein [Actinobacteria bacterium]|nr:MAG: tetratricopeptide repeat protein [Actinomycetota bacterium]
MTRDDAERLLALSREAQLMGPEAASWVERLTPEREHLLEAVRFFAAGGEDEPAAELAANVWRLWLSTGDVAGGRELLATALDSGEGKASRARALALYADGLLAFRAGAQSDSRERNEAALEAACEVDDPDASALALVGLSRVAFRDGDYTRVRTLATEALELSRNLDADARVMPLHMLAAGTRLAGDHAQAIELYNESLELNRRLGDAGMVGIELHNIGHVELHRGNIETAERCFAECAEIRNPDNPYDTAMTHLNNAALAFQRDDIEHANEALARTEATLDQAGIVLDPDDAFEVEWLRERVS